MAAYEPTRVSSYPPAFYTGLSNPSYNYPYPPTMTYEQMIAYKNNVRLHGKQYLLKRLQHNYPAKYTIIHCAIIVVLCIIQIGLQIVLIKMKAPSSSYSSGIWAACYYLLVTIFPFILVFKRNLDILAIAIALNLISGCVGVVEIWFNVEGILESQCSGFLLNECPPNYSGYFAGIIASGLMCLIMCVFYANAMFFFINEAFCFSNAKTPSPSHNSNSFRARQYRQNEDYQNDVERPAY